MNTTEQLMLALLALVVVGEIMALLTARKIRLAMELSAKAIAVKLTASEAEVRGLLTEIRGLTDGRLDLALDKVTRLETALARERGEEPPPPNPLAAHAVQPTTE